MKYLITGGAGFIGSNIVRRLLEMGHEVRVLDNFSSGREENISDIADDIELIDGDIRDFWVVTKAVRGVDYVLNQAALPSVPRSVNNPLTSNVVNIDGTLNMLEAAKQAGVKKFVTASSSSVYGDAEELPKHEKMTPNPVSPYAITKLANEHYCKVYWKLYGFPTVSLRYFNIFGPHQDPNSEYAAVIPKFITCLLEGKKPTVFGDGEQSRDFTYIDNCVEANLLAAADDRMIGDVYNVACGAHFTLNELIAQLCRIIGVTTEPVYDPPRPGDVRHSFASIDKLGALGYDPKVGFEEGLKKTVEFFSGKGTGSG
jgi:UDP-glucose 4-epimerase